MLYPDIYVKAGPECLRSLHLKLCPFGDGAADIIRQATVGEGDILPFLKEDNLCFFVVAAQTGSRSGPAGDASYNQYLHHCIFLSFLK